MRQASVFVAAFALVILGGIAIDWGWLPWVGSALAAAIGFTLIVGWSANRSDRDALRAIETGARRIALGDLETKITASLGRAHPSATAFDRMTQELKRTQSDLARSERMAAWRDIARRIAHEIKNPLLPIRISMETLQKAHARGRDDFAEILEESTGAVLEETHRLQRIVQEFSDFARMPVPKRQSVDISNVVEHLSTLFADLDCEEAGDETELTADRDQLVQLLVNLVKNGLEAAQAANAVGDAHVRLVVESSPEHVKFLVEDNGPGVSDEEQGKIFEPYHTTKSTGSGLGLAIVHRIVIDHAGTIEIGRAQIGGARFTVTLPRDRPSFPARAAEVTST